MGNSYCDVKMVCMRSKMEKICFSSYDLKIVNKGIDCNGEDSGVEIVFVWMIIIFIEKC